MPDPIETLLQDLGQARRRVKSDLSQLPASDPLISILDGVDNILIRAETDVLAAKNKAMAPLGKFREWDVSPFRNR